MVSRPRKGKQGKKPSAVREPAGFNSLSKTQQVRYLQAFWDHISERLGEVPVPESHLNLAEARLAE
jgi:hypothetical protein